MISNRRISTPARSAASAGPFFGHHVEGDDDRPRRLRERHVALVDAPHPLVHDRHADFRMGELVHLAPQSLDRALGIGLDNEGQILHGPFPGRRQNILQRAGPGPAAQHGARPLSRRLVATSRACSISDMTQNRSPAPGIALRPATLTGVDGPADSIGRS